MEKKKETSNEEEIAENEVVLSDPQMDIVESNKVRNLFMAGQGSGKSHVAAVVAYNFIFESPEVLGFIGANTHMQLTDSTLKRIFTVWRKDYGVSPYNESNPNGYYVIDRKPPSHFKTEGHDFKDYNNKIAFKNGCVVFVGSLEKYKAHDGKEFGWAILDETKDTREEAVKEVIVGRLRQKGLKNSLGKDFNPLYIFTSPAKVQWINEWFKLDEYEKDIITSIYHFPDYFKASFNNKFVTISSTYHNQRNLPEDYINDKKNDFGKELLGMLIYGNPFTRTGGEFYKCFDRSIHIAKEQIPYNPNEALHITFDFNVQPYVTLVISQVYKSKISFTIDEICLKSPLNRTVSACIEFCRRYRGHREKVFVYGDPSGDHEDTRTELGFNDFVVIKRELKKFRTVFKVLPKAPSVTQRGDFVNTIFEKNYMGLSILISPNCKETIADFTYLKETADGKKLKKRVKDSNNPELSYEEYGHTSDALDYFWTMVFIREFERFVKGVS